MISRLYLMPARGERSLQTRVSPAAYYEEELVKGAEPDVADGDFAELAFDFCTNPVVALQLKGTTTKGEVKGS
jgi:hypothetical protein